VLPASTPTPTPTPTPPPPVTITNIRLITGKRHKVTGIEVDFSGGLNAAEAQNPGIYSLTTAGKHGAFTGRGTSHPALRSAIYDATRDEVTLTLAKGFVLKKPVLFVVQGQPPGGLQDSTGAFIDGSDQGHAGDNGVFTITRGGVLRG
jgi:hypothetical protein